MRRLLLVAASLTAAAVMTVPVAAQEQASDTLFTVGKYLDYETVGEPQISRDGSQVVYTRRWVNKLEDKWDAALWIMNADGSHNRFLAKGSNAVWSPDGSRIAYLADGEPKGTQLFVRYMDASGNSTQVTRLTDTPANLKWSPDGKSLGFTMVVAAPETWNVSMPAAPEGAKWTKGPKYETKLHYRADRVGFTERGFVHLFTVSADGGTPRQITSGEWTVGYRFDGQGGPVGWDWLPDGKTIIVEAFKDGDTDADHNYRDSDLYAVDVATGATTKLTTTAGTWRNPIVSPDGKTVAFVGFPRNDDTYRVADLWTMPTTGGAMTRRTETFDREPSAMAWAPDGGGIYFTAEDRGSSNLYHWVPGAIHTLTTGAQMLNAPSVAKNGTIVLVHTTFNQPADIVAIPTGKKSLDLVQLTHVNDDLLEKVKLASAEEIWYKSTNDTKVQAWIVKPPHFDAKRHYPMLLEIHGGPHGMYNVAFNPMFQNFAANGYVVLYVNPRGSTGYGSAFGNAIKKRYPGVDVDDLLAGVDSVIGRGYVDPKRLFISGCSGGGVLSSWIIGHTTRFAAAAVRCPVTDWISMAGETDIPYFTHQWFDKPFWDDPSAWLKQSSLMYVGNVTTPTLLMTGELDMRTPIPQSEEYFAALRYRNIPAALLRFEGEYHGTSSKPSNWMRTQLYMMDWFKKYGAPPKDVSFMDRR